MRISMLALIIGLISLRFLPWLPNAFWLAGLLFAAFVFLACRLFPLGMYLLGFCWACMSAQWALNDQLEQELDGRTLWVEGRVVGLPEWPVV